MKYKIKEKSGIFFDFSIITSYAFEISAQSEEAFSLYYIDSLNYRSLVETGAFAKPERVMWAKEAVKSVSEVLLVSARPSYIVVLNNNQKEIEISMEITQKREGYPNLSGYTGFGSSATPAASGVTGCYGYSGYSGTSDYSSSDSSTS